MSNPMKLKSSPALLVAFSMVTSSLAPFVAIAPSVAQSSFSDVQGSWAQACIVELTQRNIISGYPDGTFRPNNPVTRAEYASLVGKAFPNAPRNRGAAQFVDVPSNYWAYNAITNASQTGFLSGYPGNVFNPTQSIPRAQVLVSLASGLNFAPSQPVANTLGLYADASAIPGYAQTGIAAATEKRLVVNYPDVNFLNPNQLASRAEVSTFLCQSLAGAGQFASVVPSQYVVGAAVATQRSQIVAGTLIPVSYTAAPQIVVAPNETVDLTVTVASDVRNSAGAIAIPQGSQVIGQLVPVNGGSQFVARTVVIGGQQYSINASSGIVLTKKSLRDTSLIKTLGGAALGAGASAIIGGVTGDRLQGSGNLILASSIGAAVGANQGRNLGSAIRDAAIGAAIGAGAAGVIGDRIITPKKVFTGAAAGAAIGGSIDRGTVGEVIVINPMSDLNLTLNTATTLP
ncbi:S-layer homology domain-containing protein [Phormidium sp. CLA17]|uniref:S-layer homology domain-containing protein n=1 Tax=Leptolyngbya sp. Cla-17 TaxID=2803751 RepID=UPI001492A442|nr:S-layer homology domain-containing protein [Leptolyngbya sp. Cla-17]MBM0740350.1 S-layer homology domain-containing protein [Leptolyngbya sp. Cla-17]